MITLHNISGQRRQWLGSLTKTSQVGNGFASQLICAAAALGGTQQRWKRAFAPALVLAGAFTQPGFIPLQV
jgi:hypothetical protein